MSIATNRPHPYPFGLMMSGRSWSEGYRFGFNGHELENEISGISNSYTAEYWQYDARLGRRWNIDPKVKSSQSGFSTFKNNPIFFVDPNGKDGIATVTHSPDLQKGKKVIEGGSKKNPHQVVITANYYFNSTELHFPEAKTELDNVIEMYNNSEFTVIGKDGNYYTVKFKLQALPIENLTDPNEINRKHAMNDYKGDGIDVYYRFGNVIGSDISGMEDASSDDAVASADNKRISLYGEKIDEAITNGYSLKTSLRNIFLHEIGHNLGAAHGDGSAMDPLYLEESSVTTDGNKFNVTLDNYLDSGTVEGILSTLWGGGHTYERPGRIVESPKETK